MYFDLFLPFPVVEPDQPKKKKDKGKGKQPSSGPAEVVRRSCWDGLSQVEREGIARDVALAGHLGYSVIGCTVASSSSTQIIPSPFSAGVPYPELDPRHASSSTSTPRHGSSSASTSGGKLTGPVMVQVSRFHMRLEDNKTHPMASFLQVLVPELTVDQWKYRGSQRLRYTFGPATVRQSAPVGVYRSVQPRSEPNIHHHPPPAREAIPFPPEPQADQAGPEEWCHGESIAHGHSSPQFEILYSPGLFPSPKTPPDVVRRYRQNFLSNAREVIRITGGKSIILSSGATDSDCGVRGPLDVINLATMVGMPANLAKDAISLNPKKVLLNAQARRTYKAIFSAPKMVPPPGATVPEEQAVQPAAAQAVANDSKVESRTSMAGINGVKRTADIAGLPKKKARKAL